MTVLCLGFAVSTLTEIAGAVVLSSIARVRKRAIALIALELVVLLGALRRLQLLADE